MKLTHIKLANFRSFLDEHEFELADGANFFVGPNNCGKSNLISALELSMDPESVFVPERDRPVATQGKGPPKHTRITFTFRSTNKSSPQTTLLDRARKYELALRMKQGRDPGRRAKTYADDGEIRRVVTFGAQGARQVSYQAKGLGAVSLPIDSPEHLALESQFLKVVRFGVVHSGEDLESVLNGKFREVLQLVINDHLSKQLADTEKLREKYVKGLRTVLLKPLRERVFERVSSVFSEIKIVDLLPDVPPLNDTLSSVGITLADAASTELKGKGTGLRGAVLISMLQYLAEQSRRSLVLAVEEPEAFLHPGAQEGIALQLEKLAERPEVTLLVTTHSPHIISRRADARVTELRKSKDGNTHLAATARGDEDRAELLGSLFTDRGLARVLEQATSAPAGTRAIVVTEGYTDGLFLRYGLEAAGRSDLLQGIHFISAGGAKKVVFQAVLADSATHLPVIAILDQDAHGRSARDHLKDFGWTANDHIIYLGSWPKACNLGEHPIEIEDLIPLGAASAVSQVLGDDAHDATQKCKGRTHYSYSKAWKELAIVQLPKELIGRNLDDFVWLGEEISKRIAKIAERRSRVTSISDAAASK
ncbi:putative ATP-dependent endonuclease of the OLD family [Mycolicibacterium rhodesiae NBB3]|uniref:Putative ATP-dependent endonuclease of the OLD family n=1 Tax=Mycolicibacterium rhodesiae (strain NBB3) TaxID=710685 RepID=G8RRT9_MYCRN|nr:AAA family ATPase [Mycolicibacterium rhodesiae]AEV71530.1 putative ATP-dependent endonuclease of the OLD family [Mycolicibacterium rhodesiae NBB3]